MLVTISGKGGTGKTTIAALLLQELVEAGATTPILAVDGDPASTLHLALGAPIPTSTLASVREQLRQDSRTRQSQKVDVAQVLKDAGVVTPVDEKLHLLAMGQGEGRGCYCSVNAALAAAMRALLQCYDWIVIDNEAGVEHLSRVRVPHVDCFIVVTLPAVSSQMVAQRILTTAQQVNVTWDRAGLVVNRDHGRQSIQIEGLPLWAAVPYSGALEKAEAMGQPVTTLSSNSPVRQAVRHLARQILSGE